MTGARNLYEKGWFNSILSKKEFEHRCGLSKSMDSIGPIENFSRKEDPSLTDTEKAFLIGEIVTVLVTVMLII
ncbi:Acetyl-coenzyme A carboxylase carboxyl transferase subunit beta chloroplastic [Bienertia sinuspersici]